MKAWLERRWIDEVAVNIEAVKQEYKSKVIQHPAFIEKANDWREIRLACRNYRENWLENAKWEETQYSTRQEKSNPPTRLTELAVAQGMEQILHIVNLPNERVAIYDPDHGYYHKDPSFAYKIIRLLEPNFSEAKSKNVLFMIESTRRFFM